MVKSIFVGMMVALFAFSASSAEDSVYDFEWMDKDKEVYVLQNRKFRKSGRINIALLLGNNLSNKFVDQYVGTLKGGFFFHEDWGIELGYAKAFNQNENNTAKGVLEQGAVPFYRRVDDYKTASVIWSPFYGKFNTFNYIHYVDWYFSAGLASVATSNNKNMFLVTPNRTLSKETHTGGTWSTGIIFHLSQMFSIRLEFTGVHFQADRYRESTDDPNKTFTTKAWTHNYDLNLGLNLQF
jgi:outer membrane beta-barrel protein